MSYMDDFIHKLNMIPPQADRLLRTIRQLDKEVEELRLQLQPARENFLQRLDRWNEKKSSKARQDVEEEYRQIVRIQNDMDVKSKEKISLAERLYTLIHEPTEKLDKELDQRGINKSLDDDCSKKKKGKKAIRKGVKRPQWEYDPNQPKYCYCGRPSFGEMVMCQNTYCQREWFHVDCIDEKKLPDKWFCKGCRSSEEPIAQKKGRFK